LRTALSEVPNPICCAIDCADLEDARDLARSLRGHVGGLKIGLELFVAHGPDAVRQLGALGLPILLDLKLHDIPNTVAAAVRQAGDLGAAYITLHASGGPAMLEAAADAAAGLTRPPRLLAVTVLTSLDQDDLAQIGLRADPGQQAILLASLARQCGVDGIVCSPHEIELVRAELGDEVTLVVPGIRPEGSDEDDQKRVLTPAEAMAKGADILVIGRPITAAPDPAAAARAILASLAAT
jgi:orotidine-5'-phosphate decarboxylase